MSHKISQDEYDNLPIIYHKEVLLSKDCLPHRNEKNSDILDKLKQSLKHMSKAEEIKKILVETYRENKDFCICHRRKYMKYWKTANIKIHQEDNAYILQYQEDICISCNKLLPLFSEET